MNTKIKFTFLALMLLFAQYAIAMNIEITPSSFQCGTTTVAATTGCNFMGAIEVTVDGNPSGVVITNVSLITAGAFTFDITVDASATGLGKLNFRILTSTDPTGCAFPNAQDDVAVNFTCISSSIIDFDLANVNIYPNPASDIVHITYENGILPKEMFLKNVFGTTIAKYNNTSAIDVSALQTGIYFIVFYDEYHTFTRSVAVKR